MRVVIGPRPHAARLAPSATAPVTGSRTGRGVLRYLALLCVVVLLPACGFHLRGAIPLPKVMAITHVEGTAPLSDLGRTLTRNLRSAGVSLTEDPRAASALLIIQRSQMQRRVVSVNRTGLANAYELDYRLTYMLKAPDGRVLIAPRRISLLREYTFDPNNVLAKGNEEDALRRDMIGFAVRQMLRQLQTAGE